MAEDPEKEELSEVDSSATSKDVGRLVSAEVSTGKEGVAEKSHASSGLVENGTAEATLEISADLNHQAPQSNSPPGISTDVSTETSAESSVLGGKTSEKGSEAVIERSRSNSVSEPNEDISNSQNGALPKSDTETGTGDKQKAEQEILTNGNSDAVQNPAATEDPEMMELGAGNHTPKSTDTPEVSLDKSLGSKQDKSELRKRTCAERPKEAPAAKRACSREPSRPISAQRTKSPSPSAPTPSVSASVASIPSATKKTGKKRGKILAGPNLWNCLFCTKYCSSWKELQLHLVQEKGIKIYACHLCSKGFLSKPTLLDHKCKRASQWTALKSDVSNVVRVCYQFILCGCCGLQLPLWKATSAESYSVLIENHCLDQLRNLTVYSPQRFSTAPNTAISVEFVPQVEGIPLKCRQCSVPFKSVADIEAHGFKHPAISTYRCPECTKPFGSELFFRAHLVDHQRDQLNLLALIDAVPHDSPSEKPSKEDKSFGADELISCDLCGKCTRASTYNDTHDCAVGYTRRLLVGRKLVKCPSVSVAKCTAIDMGRISSHSELTDSLANEFKRVARIELVPDKTLELSDLEDLRVVARDYLACFFCCTTLQGVEKMSEHVRVVHKNQLPSVVSDLSQYFITLNQAVIGGADEIGLACPRCHQLQCSVFALRRHLVVNHNQWIPKPYKNPEQMMPAPSGGAVKISQLGAVQSREPPVTPTIPLSEISTSTNYNSSQNHGRGIQATVLGNASLISGAGNQAVLKPTSKPGVFLLNQNMGRQVSSPMANFLAANKSQREDSGRGQSSVTEQREGVWFCPICSTKFPGVVFLRNHLEESHVFICHFCAGCYVTNQKFKTHLGSCKRSLRQDSTIFFCYVCSLSFINLKLYYTHLIQTHASKVTFDTLGQVYPMCGALLQKSKQSVTAVTDAERLGRTEAPATNISMVSRSSADNAGDAVGPTSVDKDDELVVLEEKKGQEISEETSELPSTSAQETKDDDDDLMIVEEDEEGSSKVIRIPIHSCHVCSQKFQTIGGLKGHEKTHAFDAGYTTMEVLPCPLNSVLWICRMCSLAYENQTVYTNHVSKHGTCHSCNWCTSVCFTKPQQDTHAQAHHDKKIVYGCAQCMKAFTSEFFLYCHMQITHGMILIWLCKLCGYGHSRREQLRHHLSWYHRLESQAKRDCTLGVTAHCKLHYQPADPNAYKLLLPRTAVANAKVGECVHRSFLTYNETMLVCETCGTVVSANRMLLENETLRAKGQLKLHLVSQAELAQYTTLMSVNTAVNAVASAPGVTLTANRMQYITTSPNNIVMQSRARIPVQQNPSNIRVIHHVPQTGVQSSVRFARSLNRVVHPPPFQDGSVRAQGPEVITVGVTDAQHCPDCGQSFGSVASLKVHMLKHNNQDGVFCLECGQSFKRKFTFQCHCVDRHSGKLNYRLNCPCCNMEINWSGSDALQTLTGHMEISRCFDGCSKCQLCQLKFLTPLAFKKHGENHASGGQFGCLLCGQCFATNEQQKAHSFSHACLEWLMCRECGLCFQKSYQLESHFRAEHLKLNPLAGGQSCKVCGPQHHLGTRDQILKHIADKHQVFGFKLKSVIKMNEELAMVIRQ